MRFPLPFIHLWSPMKWGRPPRLDCRECRICGRFEIYAYRSFVPADREHFPDAVPE